MSTLPLRQPDVELRERILAPLARLRARCRAYLLLHGLVQAGVLCLAAGAVQFLLDRWLLLPIAQRELLTLLVVLFCLGVLYRCILLRVAQPLSDDRLARAVDRRNPKLRDAVATAVQFSAGRVGSEYANSPELVRAVIADAAQIADRIRFDDVLNYAKLRRRVVELSGLLIAVVLLTVVLPTYVSAYWQRNWLLRETPWPQRTYITPLGHDADGIRRVPRGDPLEILAENNGRVPTSTRLEWRTRSGRSGDASMVLIGRKRWQAALGTLTEGLTFRIVGGDERTREYAIVPVERPRVTQMALRIEPPAYTHIEPLVYEQQTVVEVLAASRVQIEAQLNKPVVSAAFVGAVREPIAPCELLAADRVRAEFAPEESGVFSFVLLDADGLENRRPVRYTIKVVPDAPPSVRLTLRDVSDVITPVAEFAASVEVADDYGLAGAVLVVQRNDFPPDELALTGILVGVLEGVDETALRATEWGVVPGDRLRFRAHAGDFDPAGPNVGAAGPIELRVLSATDFLAELARRERELRREFERLISAQRVLNDGVVRLLGEISPDQPPPQTVARRIGGLARRQQVHARDCLSFAERFEQVLGELRANRVSRPGDEQRLAERIIRPLRGLGEGAIPAAVERISRARGARTAPDLDRLPVELAGLVREMEQILAQMLEWEGYREALALLQELIDFQDETHKATVDALEEELEAILDLEQLPAPTDGNDAPVPGEAP